MAVVLLIEIAQEIAEARGHGDERTSDVSDSLINKSFKGWGGTKQLAEELGEIGVIAKSSIGIDMSLDVAMA